MRKILLAILSLSLLLSGCRKDDFVSYSGMEMGQVRSGSILTDEGVKLIIGGNSENYDIQTDRRVLFRYQTTEIGSDGSYTIDLQELWETTVSEPIPASDPVGLVSDDPVRIFDAWFSGGYLNLTVAYAGIDPALHAFPLTFENDGKRAVLRLYHDVQETVPAGTELKKACLCFPMEAVTATFPAPADKSKTVVIPILLRWRWYEDDDTSRQTVLHEKQGGYRTKH